MLRLATAIHNFKWHKIYVIVKVTIYISVQDTFNNLLYKWYKLGMKAKNHCHRVNIISNRMSSGLLWWKTVMLS